MHESYGSGDLGIDLGRGNFAVPFPEPERGSFFVSRPEEFDAIAALAGAARDDALLIAGSTGSGKTFLLENVHRSPGIVSHLCKGNAAERKWAYSGLSSLLQSLLPESSSRVLTEIEDAEEQSAASLATRIIEAVRAREIRSTMLLVDDLDLMDEASQSVVGFLARRLAGTGLRIVGTVHSPPRTGPLAGIPCRELSPLDRGRATALAKAQAAGELHPAVAVAVARYASGYPQAVVENIAGLRPGQLAGKEPILLPMRPGPATVTAVEELLVGLRPAARSALKLLSMAPLMPAGIPGLADAGVDELHDSQLIQQIGPLLSINQHRVRATVYWSLGPAERAAQHHRLAEELVDIDRPLALWHRSFGDAPPSVAELFAGVSALIRRGEQVAAAELAARALTLGLPGREEALLMVEAATLFVANANFSTAKGLISLAGRASDDADVQIRLAILQVRLAFIERRELLDGLVRAAVAIFGHADPLLTRQLLDLGAAFAAELWLFDTARDWWAEAKALGEQSTIEGEDEDEDAERGLMSLTRQHRAVGSLVASVDPSDGIIDPRSGSMMGYGHGEVRPLLIQARSLTFTEQYDEARAILSMVGNLPSMGELEDTARLLIVLDNELRAGNLYLAGEAVQQIQASGSEIHASLRGYLLARYWAELGESQTVAGLIGTVNRLTSTGQGAGLAARLQAGLGRARLMDGRHDEAIRLLSLADQYGAGFDNPLLVGHEADLIEALVLGGRRDRAAEALARFDRRLQTAPSRWGTLVLARCRALLLDDQEAVCALRDHVEAWPSTDSTGHRHDYEYLRTLVSLARLHEALGQPEEAADARSRAVAGMEGLGQQGWVRCLGGSLPESPDPASSPQHPALGQLTPNERMVVEKVLIGKRNKEIAQELFVSLRTVEVRLTTVYRRLGVQSRAQLMALLAGGKGAASETG